MKRHLLLIAILFHSFFLFAQEEKEEPRKGFKKEKLFFGGNFGLTFGDHTLINVSPQIGYRFTDRIAAGMGINMLYFSVKQRDRDGDRISKSSTGVVGLNVFGRVYPIHQFFVQVQPELNYRFGKEIVYDPAGNQEYNENAEIVPSILAGGGMALPAGKGAFLISVFYDVLQHDNSPYGRKPVYNFGYNIGF
ncbi:MAG: hypothetical protein ABR502_04410 [Chitinophagaceae bacterium]